MGERIHQEVIYEAPASDIYRLLTDAERFSAMSGGAPASIDAQAGGAFSCFGGMILGRYVECEPGHSFVQAWRVKAWEPGVYSIVRVELQAEGQGTRVLLDHVGFPEGKAEHLGDGWHKNYWEPLRKALSS